MYKIQPKQKNLTEECITHNADIVDWGYVSRKINIQDFSEEFFMKFKHDIQWRDIAIFNKSMTTELAHKYENEIGAKIWLQNGKWHREDGPAFIHASGYKAWYKNGEYHREDGPAIVYPNGSQYWYQNGEQIYK